MPRPRRDRACAARSRNWASPEPAALAHVLPFLHPAARQTQAAGGDRMVQSGATDVETGAHTWTVIVAGSTSALGRALEEAESVSPPERRFVVVTARRPSGLQALA